MRHLLLAGANVPIHFGSASHFDKGQSLRPHHLRTIVFDVDSSRDVDGVACLAFLVHEQPFQLLGEYAVSTAV
jgi:hypothetical protein